MKFTTFQSPNGFVLLGSGLSTSVPDSASSEKSFGSSGSGGATVERRGSIGGKTTLGESSVHKSLWQYYPAGQRIGYLCLTCVVCVCVYVYVFVCFFYVFVCLFVSLRQW